MGSRPDEEGSASGPAGSARIGLCARDRSGDDCWPLSERRTDAPKSISFLRSLLDPGSWIHVLRMVHFYSYAHVRERRKLTLGRDVGISPNASFRNGERIEVGDGSVIGERSCLWAGSHSGRIVIGRHFIGAPEVFITASDYAMQPGPPMRAQPTRERDVVIGDDVWLGARVTVVAGVTIGDGCVVGAGSVVTRSLPPGSIAAGSPARVVDTRDGEASVSKDAGKP